MSKRTMKAFDEMYLTPVEEMAPERIREIRLRENASQAVFARYLNVTGGSVSQWERGEKRPGAASADTADTGSEERSRGSGMSSLRPRHHVAIVMMLGMKEPAHPT